MRSTIIQEQISKSISRAARILVLIAILAFFLPYASCSVGAAKVDVSLSEIAIGADKEVGVSLLGYSESEQVPLDPHPAVFLFLLLPILALALSFLKKQIARGSVYLIESISLLIYNSRVMQTIQSELSYGSYDFSRYVINKEIGYTLYQLHSWAMLVLGTASLAVWFYFSSEREESPGLSSSSEPDSFDHSNTIEDVASTTVDVRKECDKSSDSSKQSPVSTEDKTSKHESDEEIVQASSVSTKLVTSFAAQAHDEARKKDKTEAGQKGKDSNSIDDSPFSPPTGF